METFHGKQELKDMLLEEIKKHKEADEIMQGAYESDGKFCAVGCSIESLNVRLGKNYSHRDHSVYEIELGIPRIIACLEDRIFEGLTKEDSKEFPLNFIQAVPVGVDLSLVWPKFAVWILGDETDGVIQYAKTDEQRGRIQKVGDLYKQVVDGVSIESLKEDFKNAAAYAYAYAADAAAAAAAAYAYAYADTYADTYAAAAAAYAADAYAYATRPVFYAKCAAKLIEIISHS